MSNPNFVSDLVAMAKAFEELPIVQEALRGSEHQCSQLSDLVQRLELRIIDLKTELDAAHAATRKVEVERDHAERMFLETDDRQARVLGLLLGGPDEVCQVLLGNAGALELDAQLRAAAAVEPGDGERV